MEKFKLKGLITSLLFLYLFNSVQSQVDTIPLQVDSINYRVKLGMKLGMNLTLTKDEFNIQTVETNILTEENFIYLESEIGKQIGFYFIKRFTPHIGLRSEFTAVWSVIKYAYKEEIFEEIQLNRKVGTFRHEKISMQIPVLLEVSFGKIIRPILYTGFYFSLNSKGGGKLRYEETKFAEIVDDNINTFDPPRRFEGGTLYGLGKRNNFGFQIGTAIRFNISKKIDLSLGGHLQRDFLNETKRVKYKRRGIFTFLGIIFKTIDETRM